MKELSIRLQVLTVLILCSSYIHAQENPRKVSPFGFSAYGGGPTILASVSLDYFPSSKISIEAGAGAFGVYAGGRYHFKGDQPLKKWTFYTGLLYARYGTTVGVDQLFFLPLGYQYIGERGFNFAIEGLVIGEFLAGLLLNDGLTPYLLPVWPGIKLGYRFKL